MVAPNKTAPVVEIEYAPDDSWWESVLAEEERFVTLRPRPAVAAKPQPEPEPTSQQPQPSPVSVEIPAETPPLAINWEYAMSVYKQDQIIALIVSGHNRGGLLVEGADLQGFVPYSHLVDMVCEAEPQRENFLAAFTGRELRLKIIECVPEESRIVFSERAARADAGRRTQLFQSILPGHIVRGEVTNITDFGVFIDLGGVEGLIHISELSWGRVIHPANILQLGETVEVQVLEVLPERCRIALSLKRRQPNPWITVQQRYAINDIVPVNITTVVTFGVFARLEEGLEGLIHVSEMNLAEGKQVKDIYHEGQTITARILHIDPARQRLGLSLKEL